MLTKLQVVNSILRNLGSTAVTSLEVKNPDVQAAEASIDEQLIIIQSPGWWFNTQRNVTLPLTQEGCVNLPANTLKVDTAPADVDVVQHGTILFNKDTNSETFTVPPVVHIVVAIDWDNLPISARTVIKYAAMLQVQSDLEGDEGKMAKVERSLQQAIFTMKRENVSSRDTNRLSRGRAATLLRGRIGRGGSSGNFLGGSY